MNFIDKIDAALEPAVNAFDRVMMKVAPWMAFVSVAGLFYTLALTFAMSLFFPRDDFFISPDQGAKKAFISIVLLMVGNAAVRHRKKLFW